MLTKNRVHNIYLLLSAALVLFGVILGLIGLGQIHLLPGIAGSRQIHFRALLTFTYQSNLLLVCGFLLMLLLRENAARYYISISVILATTFTGLIYNFLLVPVAQAPLFFTSYVNFSTHVLAMSLALVNYFVFERKGCFNYRHVLAGMIFPGMYWLVFVNIGNRINFFPYFFMNPNDVGWLMVFVWFGALLLAFVGLGFLLMLYDRHSVKKGKHHYGINT